MSVAPGKKTMHRSEVGEDDSNNSEMSEEQNSISGMMQPEVMDSSAIYGFEYDFVEYQSAARTQEETGITEDNGESFQFNLFRPKQNPKSTDAKKVSEADAVNAQQARINIRSPTPVEQDEGNFTQPHREDSHYFISSLPAEKRSSLKAQYDVVAMSGEEIQKRSKSTKWPGTIMPWRIVQISSSRLIDKITSSPPPSKPVHPAEDTSISKRTRPSKKRRILLRKQRNLRADLKSKYQKNEQAEEEKRKKKNRDRNVKRRAREKKLKQEAASRTTKQAGDEVVSDSGASSTS